MLSIKKHVLWPHPKENLNSMPHKKYLKPYTQVLLKKKKKDPIVVMKPGKLKRKTKENKT